MIPVLRMPPGSIGASATRYSTYSNVSSNWHASRGGGSLDVWISSRRLRKNCGRAIGPTGKSSLRSCTKVRRRASRFANALVLRPRRDERWLLTAHRIGLWVTDRSPCGPAEPRGVQAAEGRDRTCHPRFLNAGVTRGPISQSSASRSSPGGGSRYHAARANRTTWHARVTDR